MTQQTMDRIVARCRQWEGTYPGAAVTVTRGDTGSTTIEMRLGDAHRTLHYDTHHPDDGRAMAECDWALDKMTPGA